MKKVSVVVPSAEQGIRSTRQVCAFVCLSFWFAVVPLPRLNVLSYRHFGEHPIQQ